MEKLINNLRLTIQHLMTLDFEHFRVYYNAETEHIKERYTLVFNNNDEKTPHFNDDTYFELYLYRDRASFSNMMKKAYSSEPLDVPCNLFEELEDQLNVHVERTFLQRAEYHLNYAQTVMGLDRIIKIENLEE